MNKCVLGCVQLKNLRNSEGTFVIKWEIRNRPPSAWQLRMSR